MPKPVTNITTVTTIAELSELVESQFEDDKQTTVLYRGHGAASFVLKPKVGRLDETPRCLVCGAALVKATESYKGLLLAPKFAIERLERVIGTYGYELAQSSGRFKREREGWTSAMYALGLAEMTGREYWVEIETVDQTPDTKVHFLISSTKVPVITWSIPPNGHSAPAKTGKEHQF